MLFATDNSQAKPDVNCAQIAVTGNSDYPPIIWRDRSDPSKLTGIAVGILEKVLNELGIEMTTEFQGNWARAQWAAKVGRADILLAPYLTNERQLWLNYFPTPIMRDPIHIVFRADNYKEIDASTFWKDITCIKRLSKKQ